MGDCYLRSLVATLPTKLESFQCRERLMGDCYEQVKLLAHLIVVAEEFQCRERLMGDCYLFLVIALLVPTAALADVSVPRTADGGLLPD